MRFAWQREFWSVEDKLRISSWAWGLNDSCGGVSPAPVRSDTWRTASTGSISCVMSLKRTDGWSCAAGDMMGSGGG
jgi:hypothetical protein